MSAELINMLKSVEKCCGCGVEKYAPHDDGCPAEALLKKLENEKPYECKTEKRCVWARYSGNLKFKIPKGLDLEDETIVSNWYVRYATLHIHYVDGREEEIESEYEFEADFKWADKLRIEDDDDDE